MAQNEVWNVVDNCANPKCMKPLHYLREGTIYIFEVVDPDARPGALNPHKLEHFWLCGDCSTGHRIERTPNREIRLVPKRAPSFVRRNVSAATTGLLAL